MIYNNYHKHTYWSNILIQDSVCTIEEYAIRAVENGGKILSSLEHGWQGNYYETYEIAQKYNLKFIFGVEAYWVKDRNEKDKTNNHICIFAKNENGRRAINKMLSEANKTGYYYRPRIDFELLFSLPPQDVFITTACIGFYGYGEESWDIILKLKEYFKENIMLEIQCHQSQRQVDINQKLLEFSKINNMQLIVGLDSHYINTEDKIKRQDYLEGNNIIYKDTDEEEWFMDYPTTDVIVERLNNQNIFALEDINKAIENTNIFLTFEDISFSSDTKMISLYPNETQEQKDKYYKGLILSGFKEYVKENNIPIETAKELYLDGIKNEVQTVIDTKMSDYFLLDYELVKKAKENGGIITTTGRGSCGSYFTNTLLGLSKMDRFTSPITLYPERFMSKTRILETKSLPDLDLNVGNQEVFAETQEQILGENHSYPMIAFGLLKTKSAFKMYARAKNLDFTISNNISNQLGQYEKALSYAEEDDKDLVDIEEYVDKEYMSYVEESKQYQKIVTSKSGHPCGFLLYQGNIDEEIGLIKCKSESTDKETLCTVIDGRTADKYGFLKNDLLKVDVVMLNYLLYKSIGMEIPTTNQLTELINKDNGKTWDIYKNGITCCINQFEKEGTTKKAMRYSPRNVAELAYFIAAIRPAFKSLYPKFEKREHFEYGIKSFDALLQTKEIPDSWILMQEQLMKVLGYAGIPLDMTYEIIKNISKKKIEKVLKYKEMFLSGFAQKLIENKDCEEPKAKELAENIWNIVNNFCSYGFNASHSLAYSYDSLYTAYFKANYPLKFYEIALNYYSQKKKKDKVALLCQEAIKFFDINILNIKFGNDNTNFNIQDEKSINKDILSIKGFGTKIGAMLYEVGKQYNANNINESFPTVYQKLLDYGIGEANLSVLIKLDYFSMFGKAQKLLSYVDLYNEFYGKKTRDKTKEYSIPMETIKLYCGKETKKQLGLFNFELLLQDEWEKIPNDDMKLKDRLESEIKYLGYLTYKNPKMKNIYMVTNFETPYSKSKPNLEIYHLADGESIKCKVKDDKKFDSTPFGIKSIIKLPTSENISYSALKQQYRKKKLELTEETNTKDWSKREIAMKCKWIDSDIIDWVLCDWQLIK